MKKTLAFVACACLVFMSLDWAVNSYAKLYPPEVPIVNPPLALRPRNWSQGRQENGSCMWASTIALLRWQEQYTLANRLRQTRGGGEVPSGFSARLAAAGVRHQVESDGSVEFLEWACRERYGAVVVIHGGAHAVCLVHMSAEAVYLLDTNSPKKYKRIPRQVFLRDWKKSGGWAFVPLYNPASPLP